MGQSGKILHPRCRIFVYSGNDLAQNLGCDNIENFDIFLGDTIQFDISISKRYIDISDLSYAIGINIPDRGQFNRLIQLV